MDRNEMIVKLTEGRLRTRFGEFVEMLFYDGKKEAIALVMGDVTNKADVLCRIHSSCLHGQVFNSIDCD